MTDKRKARPNSKTDIHEEIVLGFFFYGSAVMDMVPHQCWVGIYNTQIWARSLRESLQSFKLTLRIILLSPEFHELQLLKEMVLSLNGAPGALSSRRLCSGKCCSPTTTSPVVNSSAPVDYHHPHPKTGQGRHNDRYINSPETS